MRCSPSLYCLLALFLLLDCEPGLAACGDRTQQLRLRNTSNDLSSNGDETDQQQLAQIDLSQLSDAQLQQLMQQLNVGEQFEEDNRGSARPWKKVQRIIRRQLVRIPKRYLKKLLRQFGLARSGSVRSAAIQLQPQAPLYYLIPLE
ncbi:hypothetical protein KR093_006875 [Drosophila rubida]|uniref:Uncharacterized protein n=1 Tax=Drosophila rubida TaxID=30044 RepID=A0AAD4PS35_9MUSC|nr:hypothetical protein KR093_006875 [Drosophila rubida]